MRHEKHKLNDKLHSIPIMFGGRSPEHESLCRKFILNNKLYLVSYSIPLSCMVVLLLGSVVFVNPNLFVNDKSYAVEVDDNTFVDNVLSGEENNKLDESEDESFGGSAEDDLNYMVDPELEVVTSSSANDGISLQAASPATIAMTVTNGTGGHGAGVNDVVNTSQDANTAYRSHNVKITGSNLKSYTLTITGPASLTGPSGATKTIGGANGAYGENMLPDTWGYAWGATSDDDTKMSYKTLSSSGTTLESANSDDTNKVSLTKKLVFGANFSTTATPGNYTANVTLSVVSTPLATSFTVPDNYMQNMTKTACQEVAIGTTGILTDNRSGYVSGTMTGSNGVTHNMNQYVIIKMNDGTCWMAENLRIINTTINSTNSDMTSGSFTIPASSISGWNSSDQSSAKAYYNNDAVYGVYYNYYTATAGSAPSGSEDANYSICPKGWKLPAYGGTGSFYNIINGTNGYKSSWISLSSKNGYYLGNASAFWPAAGRVIDGSLENAGSHGSYWSRSASSGNPAYYLGFGSSSINPQLYSVRYYGYPVRCVADY